MMSHAEIVAEIVLRAAKLGLLSHYCSSGRYCIGHPGLPDIIVAGPHGVAWLEVKTPRDNLSPDQTTWRHTLLASGQQHRLIRESDLSSGIIDGILRQLAGPTRTSTPAKTPGIS